MSDEYLPEWKPWKVTASELEKLQAKDRETIDIFYFRNLDYFTSLAIRYYKSLGYFKYLYTVDDMLQEAYLHMYHILDFNSPQNLYFSLKSVFYAVAYGGRKNGSYANNKEKREAFFCTFSLQEIISENGETLEEIIPGGLSPHAVLMKERERCRQDRIEVDLEPILKSILPPWALKIWESGKDHKQVNSIIRKHAPELLQFLREHGTPEHKLKGNVVPIEIYKARPGLEERQALQALHKWQEEHFDELDYETRRKVQIRLAGRRLRARQSERKARASI